MNLTQVITIICSAVVTAATTAFLAAIKSNFRHFKALQSAQKTLIKDRIVQAHDYFCGKGSIGKYSLATIEELYQVYKDLGGNSFVESLMHEIRELEIK